MTETKQCPICCFNDAKLFPHKNAFVTDKISCPICGVYYAPSQNFSIDGLIDNEVMAWRETANEERQEKKALLKYYVRLVAKEQFKKCVKAQSEDNIFYITTEWCKEIIKKPFPTPIEQINYLIAFLGDTLKYTGKQYILNSADAKEILNLISATASVDEENLYGICKNAHELGFINVPVENFPQDNFKAVKSLFLTVKGWQKYEEIKKGRSNSKIVFMAMKFDDKQKASIKEIVEPIVKKFNFELNILSDIYTKENTIDLKLRNAIRDSRILICDLTHRNNGAYFEAGFAEGLGKPVIYICEKAKFDEKDDKNNKIHFDVEHQEIYIWEDENHIDKENPKEADKHSIEAFQEKLEAKIKAVID